MAQKLSMPKNKTMENHTGTQNTTAPENIIIFLSTKLLDLTIC